MVSSTTALSILFSARDGGDITATQTEAIDAALGNIEPSDIPDAQVQNVLDYIDNQLLHNRDHISSDMAAALKALALSLANRV